MANRTLSRNDIEAVIAIDDFRRPEVILHHLKSPDQRARLAFSFIERWGMVAGVPDGEDSAGRSKLRLAAPEEVVERAFACASLAWRTAESRNWLMSTPSIEEIDRTANGGPTDDPRNV